MINVFIHISVTGKNIQAEWLFKNFGFEDSILVGCDATSLGNGFSSPLSSSSDL
jgi:hypothetical protein